MFTIFSVRSASIVQFCEDGNSSVVKVEEAIHVRKLPLDTLDFEDGDATSSIGEDDSMDWIKGKSTGKHRFSH